MAKSKPFMPDMSVFANEVKCIVATCMERLSEENRATLEGGFGSDFSSHALFEWLDRQTDAAGVKAYNGTEQTVWRHRVGRCACRPRIDRRKK